MTSRANARGEWLGVRAPLAPKAVSGIPKLWVRERPVPHRPPPFPCLPSDQVAILFCLGFPLCFPSGSNPAPLITISCLFRACNRNPLAVGSTPPPGMPINYNMPTCAVALLPECSACIKCGLLCPRPFLGAHLLWSCHSGTAGWPSDQMKNSAL